MRELRAARAGCLDAARRLVTAPRAVVEPSGFPRLSGQVDGRAVEFRAIPDALTFRKLPALWLLATLKAPQPLRGETRIVVRPSGFEPFTTFATLPVEATLPAGFPEGAVLRTTDPADLPPPALLAGMAPLFADPRVKELVLSPHGLRLVRLVEEGPRGAYLLFREADPGRHPVDEATLRESVATLVSLAGRLAETAAAPLVSRRA